jgi:predicted AlkP superfamily pyrophosphatase or phosphodiesterase
VGAKPRLILVISIDQMRYDYLERFAKLFTGGFRRLLNAGALFENARYRHANCETGPGHAVILSGRHGSHSGMIANSWYDPLLRRVVNLVEDPTQAPVGGKGRGASPANFLGFTFGDMLKQKSPRSKVIGVSLKDRAAILMAGRRADAAYWYETAEGRFITSSYYMRTAPAWLDSWNAQHYVDRFAGTSWTRLYSDTRLYDRYAGKDAIEGEWDRKDIVFPHLLRGAPPQKEFYDDFRRTPMADEMTLGVALQAMAMHELGTDDDPDLLAIGFSATDIIGHTYGADSHEMMDQILRLDLVLEKLFAEVDRRVGLQRTLVVLTADHGSQPLVEVLQARGLEARRVHPKHLDALFAEALERRFPGSKGLIAYFDPPNFFLNEENVRKQKLSLEDVANTVADALRGSGLVDAVYTKIDFLKTPPKNDPYFEFFQNSFFESRSGHVVALMKPFVYIDDRPGGTGHGTPYEYDRHVPIFFMGPGIKPGRYPEPCGPEDIAPTLGRMLGIDYPREYDSRLLAEVLTPQMLLSPAGGMRREFNHDTGKGFAPDVGKPDAEKQEIAKPETTGKPATQAK